MLHQFQSLVLATVDLGPDDGPGHTPEPLLRLDHERQVPCAGLRPLAGEPLRHGSAELEAVCLRADAFQPGDVRFRLSSCSRVSRCFRSTRTTSHGGPDDDFQHHDFLSDEHQSATLRRASNTLSYFSQIFFVCWNMFVSASVGLCALSAIIRGLRGDAHMGNFYVDMWRVVVYMFLPASLIMGVLLLADGVPMTLEPAAKVATVEAGSMGKDDNGQAKPQQISRGPVAAIIPIKHLGTNGGGFFGANSAHPFENPSAWSNILTVMNLCLFPFTLVLMFGRMLKQMRHAWMIFGVMMSLMIVMIVWAIGWDTLQPNPALQAHADMIYPQDFPQPDGTVQHKWVIARSGNAAELVDRDPAKERGRQTAGRASLPHCPSINRWATWRARNCASARRPERPLPPRRPAITCGSVNCMHDSLNPLAGLTPLTGMWLNCIFGGKGVGMIKC